MDVQLVQNTSTPGNPNFPPPGPVNFSFQYFGINMGSFNGLVLLGGYYSDDGW